MTVKRTNEAMAKDALCIAGETVVPGTSLLAKGEYKSGLAHAGIGLAAKLALGPIGLFAVAANSYCQSKTGQSLFSQFTTTKGPGDFSLREEVASGINNGEDVDGIVESVSEDVEDIYHEMTLEAAMNAEAAVDSESATQETQSATQDTQSAAQDTQSAAQDTQVDDGAEPQNEQQDSAEQSTTTSTH